MPSGTVTPAGPSSLPPSGAAGGDLSGTYPSPTVAKVNGATPVASVFTRTGAVVATTGDYTAAQVGAIAATYAGGGNPTLTSAFAPTGALVENVPRVWAAGGDAAGPASGTLLMTPLWLPSGLALASISFVSGGTGAAAPTHQWFALYNAATLALLRQTVDDTNTAWGSDAIKTLALTSGFTTTYDGEYFVGFMVTAGTVPSLRRATSLGSGALRNLAPVPWGTSTSGLTTTAPNPAAALSTGGDAAYCYVS